jgi:2-polyprenyl-3-methyl-5-hydroxy-6-metoxy-1,4-benzoquinol methylase
MDTFKCILCNSSSHILKNKNIRKDELNIYRVLQCLECNHIQLYPNTYDTKEYYDNDNQDKESKLVHLRENDEYSEMLLNFHLQRVKILEKQKKIEKSMKIIDIGGGKGEFVKLISNKCDSVYILEPGVSRINSINEDNIITINKFLDDDFANTYENAFDIVTSFHVLEHLVNPINFLKNCYKILKPNGLLYIEVPNEDDTRIELSEYYRNNIYYCKAHISYFTDKTLKYILDKVDITNYKIDGFERYNYENYMYWITNNKPQSICTYYKGTPNSIEEELWINNRKQNLTSDSLYIIITK